MIWRGDVVVDESQVARCSSNRRSAALAAFSTSGSCAVAALRVRARFARAPRSPVRVSAGHQQTPAYRPLKRCAYSTASEVLPTPPMPCTAARPTDACVKATGLARMRMASSRLSWLARPVKVAIRGGTPMNGRGGGGAAWDWRSAAAIMRRLRSSGSPMPTRSWYHSREQAPRPARPHSAAR